MAESQDSQIPWNAETRIACAFSFPCPKTWDRLCETDDPTIRFCFCCERDVVLVETEADFRRYGEQGRCVAVPVVPSKQAGPSSEYTGPSKVMFGTPDPNFVTPEQRAEAQRLGQEWLAQQQQ